MKKLIYAAFVLCLGCVVMADDHIIQFIVNGQHYSFRTSDITSITYDYHNQDSIDQAYRDSIARDQFVRDSIAREEFLRDSLYNDSVSKWNDAHTLPNILNEANEYSLMAEALRLTGLIDSVAHWRGDTLIFKQLLRDNFTGRLYPADGVGTTGKTICNVGYTLFAETDSVMHANGIYSIDDLVAFANRTYGNAAQWYDYLRVNGLSVSTDNDYTNRLNALNMFVAYHIIKGKMAPNQLVFERGTSSYWNYAPDADPYDYYETMLPHTMLKVWEPVSIGDGRQLYINRYQTYNTLTNEVGTVGTNHQLVRKGLLIDRNNVVEASNAYILSVSGMLVYDELVPRGVLNERMRVNCTSLFPELINNRYRHWSVSDGNIPYSHDGSRIGIPNTMFDNVVHYDSDPNVCMTYCPHGAWRAYQADQIQVWGDINFSFKLPPVPGGVYELRIIYANSYYDSSMEFALGTNPYAAETFEVLDTVDYSIYVDDPRIGLTDAMQEDDRGVASDKLLRERGYMRAPYSYCGHGEYGWTVERSARFEYGTGTYALRKIIGRVQMDGQSQWLRLRRLGEGFLTYPFGIDFVELCPVGVCDNEVYMEDWY